MFSKWSLSVFSLSLSLILALAAFFLLQPMLVKAEPMASPELPFTRDQAANHSPSFNQTYRIGTISGQLSFPSERIPSLTVFALRIDNGLSTYYSIHTEKDQPSYSIEVDPGVYLVFAYHGDLAGGYTRYVTCGLGLNCSDHIPHQVAVESGDTISSIDLLDWYAPRGTFPERPDQSPKPIETPVCISYHRVAWGETLYKIGLQYNLTWKPIASANKITNPNLIYAGQVLCIPRTNLPGRSPGTRSSSIPTIDITGVIRNKQVSITTNNFPPNQTFKVTMGKMFTQGVAGMMVDETNSGSGGSFKATYTIPKQLRGLDRIAIRLESPSGYYSYNWFYNNTTQ